MDPEKKKGNIQLILVICFILGAFAVSKLLQTTYEPPGKNESADRILVVETATIQPGSHRLTFNISGVVEARSIIKIVPEATGRVVAVHDAFFTGGAFSAGETLFQIDPRDYQQAVAQRQADVERLQAALELSQAEVNAASADWKQVHGNKPIPALVAKEPQLKQAKANLMAAISQLKTAQLNLERTHFALPFNGRVLSSDIAKGQYIKAGQSYGEVFDIASLEVKASLESNHLEWLLAATEPDITFSGKYLGQTFHYKGTLKRQAAALDTSTRFATISFGIDDMSADLLPGVFTDIEVKGQKIDNVMLLPLSAMQSQGIVWIVRNNILERWQPEVIYTGTNHIAVKGKNAPIAVVTSRVAGGSSGMQVSVAGNSDYNSDAEAGND